VKVILFANTDWYLYNFRLSLARALRDSGHEVVLVSPPGGYITKLEAAGFRCEPVNMRRRSLNPIREIALLWQLRELIRRERADIVHAFTIKCAVYGSLAARWASRRKGVPARINAVAGLGYVFTSRDLKAFLLQPPVRALLKIALGGVGTRLILQNPDDLALFGRAELIDPARIRLILGSGVDCHRFDIQRIPPSRSGPFRVVLPARLLWDKGVAEYVEAARILRTEGRSVQFMLAGDPDPGNPASVPLTRVREWEAEGLVEWLGHVEDMPSLFANVDVVALPSYREGLPKSLVEAGASGLPLVTTNVPGCREVVSDECEGLLVPARDARALARAIGRLQDEPALCERFGNAARVKALTHFDERIVIARTLEVYGELVPSMPLPASPAYVPRGVS
jgi:glycosyltransferase involved in cell wall biosynthesis